MEADVPYDEDYHSSNDPMCPVRCKDVYSWTRGHGFALFLRGCTTPRSSSWGIIIESQVGKLM